MAHVFPFVVIPEASQGEGLFWEALEASAL
jgi:hypothetical protein